MTVRIAPEAEADLEVLPVIIAARLENILDRLEKWPDVSGAKALGGEWKGHHRIRTGDWRVIFRVSGREVLIVRIMHRSKVYED